MSRTGYGKLDDKSVQMPLKSPQWNSTFTDYKQFRMDDNGDHMLQNLPQWDTIRADYNKGRLDGSFTLGKTLLSRLTIIGTAQNYLSTDLYWQETTIKQPKPSHSLP